MGKLSEGEAFIISTLIKAAIDLIAKERGQKVTIDDLKPMLDNEEVRRQVLASKRKEAIEDIQP